MSGNKKDHKATKVVTPSEIKKNQVEAEEKPNSVPDLTDNADALVIEENLDIDGRDITITLVALDNIKLQSPNNEIFFKVTYRDTLLEESPKYRLPEESFSITTNWNINITAFPNHRKGRDNLISNPVCITIIEFMCLSDKSKDLFDDDPAPVLSKAPSKTVKGKESTKGSSVKSQSVKPNPFNVLGYCNLDLLPLLLGETNIINVLDVMHDETDSSATEIVATIIDDKEEKEKVKGKESKKSADSDKSAKSKLPAKNAEKAAVMKNTSPTMKSASKNKLNKPSATNEVQVTVDVNYRDTSYEEIVKLGPLLLTVRAQVQEPLLSTEELENSNMLSITLESMYNLLPDIMTETSQYEPATMIHDEFKGSHAVKLGLGRWKTVPDKCGFKRWNNLAHLRGKSSYTQQKLSEEMLSKINVLGNDFSCAIDDSSPRVEWNVTQRCWLSSQGSRYCKDNISKYGMWPVELCISSTPKSTEDNSKKKKNKLVTVGTVQEESKYHCIAFFDAKKLLYPGVKRIHVVGQVFTFCGDDMKAKCGIESPVFSLPRVTDLSIQNKISGSDKNKGKGTAMKIKSSKGSDQNNKTTDKSKSSTMNDTNSGSASTKKKVNISNATSKEGSKAAEEEFPKCVPEALYLENGKPVFVTLELEFWKPLTKKRTHNVLFKEIDRMIPKPQSVHNDHTATKKEHAEFVECIQSQAAILSTEYQKFLKDHVHISTPTNSHCNLGKDFFLYLCGKGTHQLLKNNLSEKVKLLIVNKPDFHKYHEGSSGNYQNAKRNYVSHMYTLLIDEMHTAINNLYDGREATYDYEPYQLTERQLEIFVSETEEQEQFSAAEKLHLRRIQSGKSTHKYLLDYAVFCVGQGYMWKAEEIVLDALSLENRDQLSLLIYALILAHKSDKKQAETVFEALMSLYPNFWYGGMAFHLFYRNLGNHTGAEVILEHVYKCIDAKPDQLSITHLDNSPICWTPDAYPLESTFLATAVFLMKIKALDYADLALTEELRQEGPSIGYYYFLAVSHYLSERYHEAIAILEALLRDHGRDCIMRSLLGHCQYRIQDRDGAKYSYQFVANSAIRKNDIYLVSIRLGEFYFEDEEYGSSKNTFLEACINCPSATSWLGVGKACYMLGEFEESERALTEANILNNTCPATWGYLTLLNLQFLRCHEYEQCYSRALKCKLQDESVLQQIEELRNKRHYPYPCVISQKY